jgi:PilZ domain
MKKAYVKPVIRSRAIRPGEIDAGARFAQKRSVPRYPFAARVTVIDPIKMSEVAAKTSDISLKGCYVESVDQFPPNTIVRVTIEQAAEFFETWGRIAHVQAGLGTGIAFFEASPEERLTIQSWIAKLTEFLDRSGI